MCDALRELMKDEIEAEVSKRIADGIAEELPKRVAEERAKVLAEGRIKGYVELIKNLMDSMKITAEDAMNKLQIPAEEQELLSPMLCK